MGARLRIAQVTEFYYPHLGGICEHVHFLAREAALRGHHVDIITSNMAGATGEPNVLRIGRSVPVYCNGALARITVGAALRQQVRDVLRRGEYDIVHVHTPLAPTLPLLAVDEATCPVVGTFHTYFDYSVGYTLGRHYFQRRFSRLSAAIAVSPTVIEAHERYFRGDWTLIPNGVDTSLFSPSAPHPSGVRRDVPAVLFLGRFDPRNGLASLISAFKRVRGARRPAQLVVVGDGPLAAHYRRLAGGDRDITFVGAVLRDRPRYYANCAVYACPTTRASFGITLLEAMACGAPIVCSDINGFRNVVAHEREAILVPCGDDRALADGLARLLDDSALRARLGAAGREGALAYDWRCVSETIFALYARLLGACQLAA